MTIRHPAKRTLLAAVSVLCAAAVSFIVYEFSASISNELVHELFAKLSGTVYFFAVAFVPLRTRSVAVLVPRPATYPVRSALAPTAAPQTRRGSAAGTFAATNSSHQSRAQKLSSNRGRRFSPGISSGRGGIRTPDFCLRRGWDEITKASLCRIFRGKVDQAKCRKAQLDAPKRHQTRHRAGLTSTTNQRHWCSRSGARSGSCEPRTTSCESVDPRRRPRAPWNPSRQWFR